MSNDYKEVKENKELCEEKQEARKLTEEELKQVTGGINPSAVMPILFAQPFMQISPQIDR